MITKIKNIEKGIEIEFDQEVTIVKAEEELLTLSDGTTLSSYHERSCCEHHWADFSTLEVNPDHKKGFSKLTLEGVEGLGFLMNKMLVNCYGSKNGYYSYYSSDLELRINHGTLEYRWNISDFQDIEGG